MNSKIDERDDTDFDFKAQLKKQNRITVPTITRELKNLEVGDVLKVKVWLYRKSEK